MNNLHKAYIANFLQYLHFFGPIAVPFFIDWLQVDYTKMFLLQAWFVFWCVALEIPTGIVADKYGRKVSIALGTLLFGVDMLFFGLTRTYALLFVAEFIGAVGTTLVSGADQAFLYDSLIELKKKKEAKYFLSRFDAAGTLGILVAFPVGSFIASGTIVQYPYSLAFTFVMSCVAVWAASLVYLSAKEPKRVTPTENFVVMGVNGLKQLFKHKQLRAYTLNFAIITALTFFMFWFYQSLAGVIGLPLQYYGWIGAGSNLFALLLLTNVKPLEKLFGMQNIIFYSAFVPALLYLGLAYFKNPVFVIAAIFMVIGLKQLRAPLLADFMNQHIESKHRATVISSAALLVRAGIFILYPIVGLLADMSLDYALLFLGALTFVFALLTRIEADYVK